MRKNTLQRISLQGVLVSYCAAWEEVSDTCCEVLEAVLFSTEGGISTEEVSSTGLLEA